MQRRVLEESFLMFQNGIRAVNRCRDSKCHIVIDHSDPLCTDDCSLENDRDSSFGHLFAPEKVEQSIPIEMGIEKCSPFRETASQVVPEWFAFHRTRYPFRGIHLIMQPVIVGHGCGNEFMFHSWWTEIEQCRVMQIAHIQIIQGLALM